MQVDACQKACAVIDTAAFTMDVTTLTPTKHTKSQKPKSVEESVQIAKNRSGSKKKKKPFSLRKSKRDSVHSLTESPEKLPTKSPLAAGSAAASPQLSPSPGLIVPETLYPILDFDDDDDDNTVPNTPDQADRADQAAAAHETRQADTESSMVVEETQLFAIDTDDEGEAVSDPGPDADADEGPTADSPAKSPAKSPVKDPPAKQAIKRTATHGALKVSTAAVPEPDADEEPTEESPTKESSVKGTSKRGALQDITTQGSSTKLSKRKRPTKKAEAVAVTQVAPDATKAVPKGKEAKTPEATKARVQTVPKKKTASKRDKARVKRVFVLSSLSDMDVILPTIK
jgi:hypothetical protein